MLSAETYAPGTAPTQGREWRKSALVIGFLALAIGIEVARRAPPTGYEVSIYAATPVAFWAGVGVALSVALAVAAVSPDDVDAGPVFLLGAGALTAVVSLPLIRGYYFYGLADGLTHLGWTREMLAGSLAPTELFYPVGHLLAIAAHEVLGVDPNRAVMLVVPIFAFLYFLFVMLCVRALVEETGAALVAAFVSFTVLPVFNVGTPLQFHPFTQAVLFAPFFVFLLIAYASRTSTLSEADWPVTEFDLLLLVGGVAFVLLHSQAFADVLVLMGALVGLQLLYRFLAQGSSIADHRLVAGQFLVLTGLFLAWNVNHPAFAGTLSQVTTALTGGSTPGAVVQQRGASLTAIGSGILEIFLKVFLVDLLVALFAAWLVVTSLFGRAGDRTDNVEAWTRYLFVGGIALGFFAVLHFFGTVSSYFFRHIGFGLVLVALLGGAGVYYATRSAPDRVRSWPVATVVGVVVLALSIAVMFPSPYVYTPNHQVTESQASGYEAAFEHRAPGVAFAGVRGGADRYSDAFPGVGQESSLPVYGETIRSGLPSQFDADRYLVVTETDRQREVEAYRGLRVSESDFQSIESQVGVSRVQSTDEFQLYYVAAESSE